MNLFRRHKALAALSFDASCSTVEANENANDGDDWMVEDHSEVNKKTTQNRDVGEVEPQKEEATNSQKVEGSKAELIKPAQFLKRLMLEKERQASPTPWVSSGQAGRSSPSLQSVKSVNFNPFSISTPIPFEQLHFEESSDSTSLPPDDGSEHDEGTINNEKQMSCLSRTSFSMQTQNLYERYEYTNTPRIITPSKMNLLYADLPPLVPIQPFSETFDFEPPDKSDDKHEILKRLMLKKKRQPSPTPSTSSVDSISAKFSGQAGRSSPSLQSVKSVNFKPFSISTPIPFERPLYEESSDSTSLPPSEPDERTIITEKQMCFDFEPLEESDDEQKTAAEIKALSPNKGRLGYEFLDSESEDYDLNHEREKVREEVRHLEFEADTEDEEAFGQNNLDHSLEAPSSCPDDYADEDFTERNTTMDDNNETLVEKTPKAFLDKLAVDDELFFLNFPEVIRDPSIVLPFQEIPKGEISIHISEVFSPIHFWFQYEHQIENLMAQLQESYQNMKQGHLAISDINVKPGLLIACYLKEYKKWHRALVINPVDSNDMVRMIMFDYGTVGLIHKKNIKFLFASFLKYPRFSLRGRFVNLKPPNLERQWEEKEVEKMLMFVGNRELKAVVQRFDEVDKAYELDITLTLKKVQYNVREWLIGNCVATEFELKPNGIYPSCYYFPSFDMLEKNYPTFHEKSIMLAQGTDYDTLVETKFLSNVTPTQLKTMPKLLRMLGHEKFKHAKKYYFPAKHQD